jgi:cytidine deaminase
MSSIVKTKVGPELFVGLAAAVGTDLEKVIAKLSEALKRVDYQPHPLRLASLLKELPDYAGKLTFSPADRYIDTHMTQGNELRKQTGLNDALAILAIAEIQKQRQEAGLAQGHILSRCAYILRSLKHPEEVKTLRNIYGDSFYLVAAYAPHAQRRDYLAQRIASSHNESSANKYYPEAERLILRDQEELDLPHGQNLRDTFHRADVFRLTKRLAEAARFAKPDANHVKSIKQAANQVQNDLDRIEKHCGDTIRLAAEIALAIAAADAALAAAATVVAAA